MPRRKLALAEKFLNFIGQSKQAHKIGDVTAALAEHLGQLFLRMSEFFHQLTITGSLFHGVQIGALDVLDDRDFQNFGIVEIPHQNWQFVQFGHLRRAPAAFAGDDLVFARRTRTMAHDQGLDDTLFANRRGKFLKVILGKAATRLFRVGMDLLDRHDTVSRRINRLGRRGLVCLADIGHERRKPPPQAAILRFPVGHVAFLSQAGTPACFSSSSEASALYAFAPFDAGS